jgi:Ferroportin1 (FPN1)
MSPVNVTPNQLSPHRRDLVPISEGDVEFQRFLPELESDAIDTDELETSAGAIAQPSASAHGVSRRLYISHFLSTWNSRVFEFGAVLFIAKIFPGTLLPVSIYAVVRSASAIVLSPNIGRYIDVHDRLKVLRTSIGKSIDICPRKAILF